MERAPTPARHARRRPTPAAIREPLRDEQQRISSKGRSGGIRRVPVTERTERQHLPQALPRGGKKIRERICRRTKVANPAARRQRSGMKQNSAGALEWHSKSILSLLIERR